MIPTCTLLIGVPASGKSTYSKGILTPHIRVSSDDVIDNIASMVNDTYSNIFEMCIKYANESAERLFNQALIMRENIIVDRTNLSEKSRKVWIDRAKFCGYKVHAVVFDIPEEDELKTRLASRPGKNIPWHVIQGMKANFKRPTADEGFDSITEYKSVELV